MKKDFAKEKDTQRLILDYLRITKQTFWRNNTGAFKNKEGNFYRFGDLGSPDIFIVRKGQIYGIEVKGTNGKQSEYQKEWQTKFEKSGGIYLLVYSPEEFIKKYSLIQEV